MACCIVIESFLACFLLCLSCGAEGCRLIPSTKNECSICLDEIGKLSKKKLNCGHIYHIWCYNEWLKKGQPTTINCPNCGK